MTEWIECKLSDLGEIVGGATPSTKDYSNYDGDIAWLTPKDLSSFSERYIEKGERSISEKGFKSCSTKMLPINSILFSSRAPIGYVAIAAKELCTNQGFKSIIPNSKVDYMFLYYLLKYKKKVIEGLGSGTTFKEVSGNVMKNVMVYIPKDKVVQKKIAGILDKIDCKIENNNNINRNLLEQLKAIFDAWFYTMEHFDGKELEGTEYIPIEKLCESVTKGTTPTTLGMPFVDEGINFIKGETILDTHGFDRTKMSFISEDTYEKMKRSQVQTGDIVFTIAGTLGRFALVDDTIVPANTNQAVAIIRAKRVSPEYLYSFFLGNWHNEYYTKRIQQAVQANLSLGTIKSLPIAVLPQKYYQEYLDIINPLIMETKRIETQNIKLLELRDSLLPKLMSCELDVSNLDI